MAKKAGKKRSTKKAKATVHFTTQRLAKIAKVAHKAGVRDGFNKTLGKSKEIVFVRMSRSKLQKLKDLHPKIAKHLDDCDCDENDPFCVCT
jgi:hypothetical protein